MIADWLLTGCCQAAGRLLAGCWLTAGCWPAPG